MSIIVPILHHYHLRKNEAHLHVKDRHNILVLEVLVNGGRGFLEQPKEDVTIQLDRLHTRAEKIWYYCSWHLRNSAF